LVKVVGSGIDLGLKLATTGVQAGLVGGNSLSAVFLMVVGNLTEDTNLLVSVQVVALRVVISPLRVVPP
jgi:hypothetical protein